jgi:hypothetical protein
MTNKNTKVKTRKGKKRPKTPADEQLNQVEKMMMNVNRIHKRV